MKEIEINRMSVKTKEGKGAPNIWRNQIIHQYDIQETDCDSKHIASISLVIYIDVLKPEHTMQHLYMAQLTLPGLI